MITLLRLIIVLVYLAAAVEVLLREPARQQKSTGIDIYFFGKKI